MWSWTPRPELICPGVAAVQQDLAQMDGPRAARPTKDRHADHVMRPLPGSHSPTGPIAAGLERRPTSRSPVKRPRFEPLMESINGLCKAECIRTTVSHDGTHKTIADVVYATAGWVDWYNNRRVHSTRSLTRFRHADISC